MKIKSNRGATGVDIAVAVVIIMIFVSFIAGLFYNVASTSKKVERKSAATNLAIKVIEAMKITEFEELETTENAENDNFVDLTSDEINQLINEKLPNGYKVSIYIEDYNNENIIKIIKAKVTYRIGKNTEDVTIETLVKNI